MPINIERGNIRKVYRAKSKELGWCAIPLIELDKGDLVAPVASFEQWPIPWIASFVGHRVEVVIDSNEKCFLLPFHNQHQLLLPPLIELMSDNDPGTFQSLPLLEQGEEESEQIAEAVKPITAAAKALDQIFKSQPKHPRREGQTKAGFLSELARKHLELNERLAKDKFHEMAIVNRESYKKRRHRDKARQTLLLDALLKTVLRKKFRTRLGAKVRADMALYLRENENNAIEPAAVIDVIKELARKHSGSSSNK